MGEILELHQIKISNIKILSFCLLLFSYLIISTTLLITPNSPSFSIQEISTTREVSLELFTDLWESAWVWADSTGWIDSRVEVQSKDLGFGEQNLNLFIASYPLIYELFDHANWEFRQPNDPGDQNTEVRIHFRTNNAPTAKDYADLIIKYMSKDLLIGYDFVGTWAWEDWREDKWIDLTGVLYRSHIDWPWFTEFVNNSIIPRNVGGLAETIDVTTANHINAWAWPSGDYNNPEVCFAFGFNFNRNIFDITGRYFGNHMFNLNDLIHTKKIQKNAYQSHLWLTVELPNVESISQYPSSNSSACIIYQNYHPPPEPWVTNHYWDINFEILGGIHTFLSVSFTYDFLPDFLQTSMETSIIINQYGYSFKDINLRGAYSRLIDFESLGNWDSNIILVELTFRPSRENLWNNFELLMYYNDYNEHYTAANAVAIDIADLLSISFSNNYTEEYKWDWSELHYEGKGYRFHSDEFTAIMSQNLLTNSNILKSSPVFFNQDMNTLEYTQWSVYHPNVDQWIDQIDFRWNPLNEEIISPIKAYSGIQTDLNINLLSEWNWPSFPFCSNYSISRFNIIVPYESFMFYPQENNGWGWHINTWTEDWWNLPFIHHYLEIFTDAASLEFVDEYGTPNGTLFNDFGIKINYTFLEDNIDTSPPDGNFYYHNVTSGEEYWGEWDIQQQNITFKGLESHLHVRVWDDTAYGIHNFGYPFYFWNGTHWEPRFHSSGINTTTIKAYFADLPIQTTQFEREIPFTVYWEDGPVIDYNISWDTTNGFADGYWTIVAYSTDYDNNSNSFAIHNLLVDNYDESTTDPPIIELLSVENTSVYGTHTIQTKVTDDIDIFAVVLTKDATAFLLTDTNADNIFEFDWNTLGESENSIHFFTITAWDMDGHKIIYGFWLQVDNIRPGNPPTIEIISPSMDNETLTGFYTFQVQVTDDLGITSVKMQIDRGVMYTMDLNPLTGYYEYIHDLTTEINGYRILNITVVDIDENQHTEHSKRAFTVVGGQEGPIVSNPPEWNPSLSELPENLSDYVNAGNLVDYDPVSENIYFKVAAKDDRKISIVDFKIYVIEDFNSITGDPKLGRMVIDSKMTLSRSEAEWFIYEYSWDSTKETDDYYLCEIDVQDDDTVVNHLYIKIILQTDNVKGEEPTIAGIPGFNIDSIIISLIICYITKITIKQKRYLK